MCAEYYLGSHNNKGEIVMVGSYSYEESELVPLRFPVYYYGVFIKKKYKMNTN